MRLNKKPLEIKINLTPKQKRILELMDKEVWINHRTILERLDPNKLITDPCWKDIRLNMIVLVKGGLVEERKGIKGVTRRCRSGKNRNKARRMVWEYRVVS